ncbi:hypothetical protein RKD55_003384 [Rossellomorea marisflavi]
MSAVIGHIGGKGKVMDGMKRILMILFVAILLSGCSLTKLGKVFPSSSQAEETSGEEATETAQEKSEKPSNLEKANELVEEANKKLDEIERGDEPVKGEGELLLFIEQEVFPIGQREAAVEQRLYDSLSAFEMNGDKEAAFETVDWAMKEYESILEDAENVRTYMDEQEPLKEELIHGVMLFQEYLRMIRDAIDDPSEWTGANIMGAEYDASVEKYHSMVTELSEKYGINYQVGQPE